MSQRTLIVEFGWIDGFRALAADDPVTARRLSAVVKGLAKIPEPQGSIHRGDSLIHRLHVGDYRVLYEVTDDVVRVWSLGRVPG